MKKSLFLLPLLAGLALCGCKDDNGGKGGDDDPSGGDYTALDMTLDFDTISAAIEESGGSGSGYDAVSAVEEIDGQAVTFENVCINRLGIEKAVPEWDTGGEEVHVVQFKNPSKGAGVISFTDVTATKVTINLLTSYSVSGDFKVTYGGKKQKMKAGAGEETGYESVNGEKTFPISLYALTFDLSGEGGDLEITNQGQGARYVQSIVIE